MFALPDGEPDLAELTLRVADLPAGFELEEEEYIDPQGSVANYLRSVWAPEPVAIGDSQVFFLLMSPVLEVDEARASVLFEFLDSAFSDSGQENVDFLAEAMLLEQEDEPFALVEARPLRVERVGERATGLRGRFEDGPYRMAAFGLMFQVGRTVTALVVRGEDGQLHLDDVAALGRQLAERIERGLEAHEAASGDSESPD